MKPILRLLIIAAAFVPVALAHPGHGEPAVNHDHHVEPMLQLDPTQMLLIAAAVVAVAFAVSKLVTHLKTRRAARKP